MVKRYSYTEIKKNYDVLRGKRVIIWCRSISGLMLYKTLCNHHIDVIGFTDSFVAKSGEIFAGLPVYTFKEIEELKDAAIYIATNNSEFKMEILEQIAKLKHMEVFTEGLVFGAVSFDTAHANRRIQNADKKIRFIKEKLEDEKSKKVFEYLLEYRSTNNRDLISEIYERNQMQYFPDDGIIKPVEDEIFVDAGAYDGETTCNFCKWLRGSSKKYSKVYLMEPDSLMFQIMKEYVSLRRIENTVPVNSGAYSFSGTLKFVEDALTGSSRICENGEKEVMVVSIDDMVGDDKVTFIKMDIEGAEMEALEGAKQTIERNRPKLAISIYHKEEDLWEIPFYILSKYPWYKIYMRHYTLTTNETVLYATV